MERRFCGSFFRQEQVLSDWAHVSGGMTNEEEKAGEAEEDGVTPIRQTTPIRQMAVVVSGDHGSVFIDTLGDLEDGRADGAGRGGATENVSIRNQLIGIQSSLLGLRQENLESRNVQKAFSTQTERNFSIVNGNVR